MGEGLGYCGSLFLCTKCRLRFPFERVVEAPTPTGSYPFLTTATRLRRASVEKAFTMMFHIDGEGFLFGWESAFADGTVGTAMTVLTLSVTLARATSPKGEALLNV